MATQPEVLPAEAFRADFAAEVRRAKRYNSILAYVELAIDIPRAEELAGVLRAGLRESDLLGELAPGRFGIVLISADADAADLVGRRLAAAAQEKGFAPSVRRAVFPFDGLETHALVAALASVA